MSNALSLTVVISALMVLTSGTSAVLATDTKAPSAKDAPTNQIGYVGMALNGAKITKVFNDSPAAQGALAAGDEIESIDKQPTAKMAADEPNRRMRGPLNSSVSIVIKRGGQRFACVLKRTLTADAQDKLEHPIQRSESRTPWKGPPGTHAP